MERNKMAMGNADSLPSGALWARLIPQELAGELSVLRARQ